MADCLHLQPKHRRVLEALLREHLPDVEVWAYGSRVSGRSHDGSDLDLVLRGPSLKEIPIGQLGDFEEAVRESTLPFLVEARDWARLPERFHREIEWDHKVLIERKELPASEQWREFSLGELTDNFDSIRVPVKREDRRSGPYPYYGASGVVDYVDDYLFDGEFLLIAEDGENLRTRNTPIAFLADGKFWVNNHAHIVQGSHKANTRFLMYALSDLDISGYLTGSTMPKLTQDNLNRISLRAPPLHKQEAIAHILGTLDDKIELNRRMNETLEAMARALFKSWFVDFDPVCAKMEGRDPGLPEPVADLFPDHLVDSELGEIPEGWQPRTLRDISSLNPENWKSNDPPENIRYVDLTNTKWGRIERAEFYPWEKAPSRARRILRKSDTIVSTVRPGNGSFALVDEDGLTGSTGFAVLRPNGPADRALVWCAATSGENIDRLSHLADGGAYPAVQPGEVLSTPVVVALPDVRSAFSRLSDSMLDRMEESKRESRHLVSLRDALLPKLISGNIRVSRN